MKEEENIKGLGGWLILLGFSILSMPIRLMKELYSTYYSIVSERILQALFDGKSDMYDPYLGSLVLGEIIFNIFIIIFTIHLCFLFFTKNYLFPRLFIFLVILTLVFIPIDAYLGSLFFPDDPVFDEDTKKEFMRSFITFCIWIPYMLISKRVKNTFIEKKPI